MKEDFQFFGVLVSLSDCALFLHFHPWWITFQIYKIRTWNFVYRPSSGKHKQHTNQNAAPCFIKNPWYLPINRLCEISLTVLVFKGFCFCYDADFTQSWTLIFFIFFAKKRLISTWSRKLQNTSQKKNQEVNWKRRCFFFFFMLRTLYVGLSWKWHNFRFWGYNLAACTPKHGL